MERKDFLRGIGLAGAVAFIPFKSIWACTVVPAEIAGPTLFYQDN